MNHRVHEYELTLFDLQTTCLMQEFDAGNSVCTLWHGQEPVDHTPGTGCRMPNDGRFPDMKKRDAV